MRNRITRRRRDTGRMAGQIRMRTAMSRTRGMSRTNLARAANS